MKKTILLLTLAVLGVLLSISTASAYCYNGATPCGAMQITYEPVRSYVNYNAMPVRVGGFFGASSPYIVGLRPGVYQQMPCIDRPAVVYSPYTRTGGYYGNTLSTGTYTFGSYGAKYATAPYVYNGA